MSTDEFTRDREVIEAAMAGEWIVVSDWDNYAVLSKTANHYVVHSPSRHRLNNPYGHWTRANDAEFIARARTRWPIALDALAAAEAKLAAAEKLVESMRTLLHSPLCHLRHMAREALADYDAAREEAQ